MTEDLLTQAVVAAYDAGEAILRLYTADVAVAYKEDRSPLTAADRAANAVIVAALGAASETPILSEESRLVPWSERCGWDRLWLVDPLDGTKEFLKRNGEFTVNIALIDHGVPVLGVVYAPVLRVLYAGVAGHGAYLARQGEHFADAAELAADAAQPQRRWQRLPAVAAGSGAALRIVASRSHRNPETDAYIADLEAVHGPAELVSIGSSLKLCLVAEGGADVYPRLAPTMEWDTAAAHAVVAAAGGRVLQAGSPQPLAYNKPDLLNPSFVACRAHWPAAC